MTTSTIKLIQTNIKKHRENKGLTQEVLAEAIDVTTDYISLIERGKRVPSLKVLILIAETLKLNPINFL